MLWLDSNNGNGKPGTFNNLQLDIVGFLAILGEGSVKANAQVSSLSLFSLLPRLLPAPQALILNTRPESLSPESGKVIGARSGGIRDNVNHIANLLHSKDPLPAYAVRCERITKPHLDDTVTANRFGPLTWLALLGTAMSIALLVLSIVRSDGMALLATILLSLLSSLIGFGSRWTLILMKRQHDRALTPDSVVIKYPRGAFLIIKCEEEISRELYWHPEECHYKVGNTTYRIMSLVGTIMLMFGVICLGNSTLPLQLAFAAAFLILNAAYWVVAALPPQWHWDLNCYKVEREEYEGGERNKSFTLALWKAIAITGTADWVRESQSAPFTDGWKRWLAKAGEEVEKEMEKDDGSGDEVVGEKGKVMKLPTWDASQALTDFLTQNRPGNNV